MAGTLAAVGYQRFLTAAGAPLAGGLIYTYVTGTTTDSPTYTDAALSVAHANPIVLPADGGATIYQGAVTQKWVVKNSAGVEQQSIDPVTSITSATSTAIGAAIFEFGGDPTVPITATSYPSGATFDKCHAGTSWFPIDSDNLVGTYTLQAMMIGNGSVTVSAALVNLSEGAPDTAIVTVTSTSTTGDQQTSSAITFSAGGTSRTYAIKVKVSSGSGYVWAVNLVRSA